MRDIRPQHVLSPVHHLVNFLAMPEELEVHETRLVPAIKNGNIYVRNNVLIVSGNWTLTSNSGIQTFHT